MELPFLGTWECAIDEKRRLTLPARLRELLTAIEASPELMVTRGHKGCLYVIPPKTWNELKPGLFRGVMGGDEGAVKLRHLMARYGNLARIDNSGRITLTDLQVKVAGLEKEAIVFGSYNRIEIWNPRRFEEAFPLPADGEEYDRLLSGYVDGAPKRGEEP